MEQKTLHDSETPAQGQQVITACALIHHNFDGVTKVFLPRRATTKQFLPGVFEIPGGHIDVGEDIVEGLKREILEELGMHINAGDPFAAFTYNNEIKGSHSVEVVYFATFQDPLENITLNQEDHAEFRWVSYDEVDSVCERNDVEVRNIKKGLAILHGEKLDSAQVHQL